MNDQCRLIVGQCYIPLQKCARLVTNTDNFSVSIWCLSAQFITDDLGHVCVDSTAKTTVRCDSDDQLVVFGHRDFGGARLFNKRLGNGDTA